LGTPNEKGENNFFLKKIDKCIPDQNKKEELCCGGVKPPPPLVRTSGY